MAHRERVLVLFCLVGFIFASTSFAFRIEKSSARVLVTEDRSVEDGYMVEIETNGETRQLNLSPMESIWSEGAQLLIIDTNEKGEEVLEYKNIPQEFKVYHDSATGSVLSVKEGKINGILDPDYMIQSEEDGTHFIKKSNKKISYESDYLEIPEDISEMVYKRVMTERNSSLPIPIPMDNVDYRQSGQNVTKVEIAVVVDSTLAAAIGNNSQVYEYVTIFWNSVGKRYATITSPKIVIKLVGSVIIRNTADEPFITKYIINGTARFNGFSCLTDFGKWVYSNLATLPAHDIMYLQTGRDMVDYSNNTGLAGIAYLGLACVKNGANKSYAVSEGEDRGAYFDGVRTAAHEIAHNLGSPHDNDTASGTGNCSWNTGNIMSYVSGVNNSLFFSSCSISKMAAFIASSTAACLKTDLTTTVPAGVYTSTKLPGEVVSMTQQCKKVFGNINATVYTGLSPEDIHCYNLHCIFSDGTYTYLGYSNRPAGEGATCPSGKHCHDGRCI